MAFYGTPHDIAHAPHVTPRAGNVPNEELSALIVVVVIVVIITITNTIPWQSLFRRHIIRRPTPAPPIRRKRRLIARRNAREPEIAQLGPRPPHVRSIRRRAQEDVRQRHIIMHHSAANHISIHSPVLIHHATRIHERVKERPEERFREERAGKA
jgi:hypothetical protein